MNASAFGESLRQLRMEKGLSQQQLSDALRVDRSTVAKWESGSRLPDADMISLLYRHLGADVGELLHTPENSSERVNVILVDDVKLILDGSVPVLREALPGAEITGFTVPAEALDYARENRVSLAFLDIEMGRFSGLTLCRELLSVYPRTNVIYLTAYREYSFEAWETGASGFLLKPLTVEAVRRELTRLRYPFRLAGAAADSGA